MKSAHVAFFCLTVALSPLEAQTPGTPAPGGTGTTPPVTPGSRTPGNNGNPTNPNNQRANPAPSMPVYISGKVMVSDGSPLPHGVTIKSVCATSQRTVANADSKGYFSFEWGHETSVVPDASDPFDSSRGGNNSAFGNSRGADLFGDRGGAGTGNGSGPSMMGCELRAEAPGFRSDALLLVNHRSLDDPDVGTIVLYRMAGVEGISVSATALNAPKDARKAYEKGVQLLRKGKAEEAEKDFEKAVEIYPQYANAWLDLGRAQLVKKAPVAAAEAFHKAIEADPKLVQAQGELGMMAARQSNWQEAVKYLDAAVKLDPIGYPQFWYADGVAHYNLKNMDAAEKSVRAFLQHDPQHRNPQAQHLLGVILALKNDLPGAVGALQTYLKLAPAAADIEQTKSQLAEIQSAQASIDKTR